MRLPNRRVSRIFMIIRDLRRGGLRSPSEEFIETMRTLHEEWKNGFDAGVKNSDDSNKK